MKDSWPNGCKAINRAKNSRLWSASVDEDTLRPFSPAHKPLFETEEERGWKMMSGEKGGGYTIKRTHF